MRPPAPSLDVIAARGQQQQQQQQQVPPEQQSSQQQDQEQAQQVMGSPIADNSTSTLAGDSTPNPPPITVSEDARDSRSSSSASSPVPADNEESDFFHGANDSQSSLGVMPNLQDMQVNDQDCLPTVAALPSEILISIFSHLDKTKELLTAMLVCKRWARNIVEILWHRPSCTTWERHKSICYTLSSENPFFTYYEFIKRLNLAALAGNVSDGSIEPLAVCTRVERLTLTNCKNLTDSGLVPLVKNNHNLLALDISGDVNITEATIYAIAENCRRLQGLNMSSCKQITSESMVQLAESCKYIKRLKLNDCDQLNDTAVLAFANRCPNILEIDLHQVKNVGNEPVTTLLAKGRSLRELRLANCELIDDGAFLSLPPHQIYENLRILDLTSCTLLSDRAVEKIINAAPKLRNLVLAKCGNISDASVYAIAGLGKNLHFLHLGHCRHITDEAVKYLVKKCNRIRYIDLGCCNNLTDESVTQLATLPKLKRIGLVKCASITNDSMYALARANYRTRSRRDAAGTTFQEYHASSLERVHLSYCTNLSLPAIIRLLNCCPKLTHLSLTGVTAFLRDDLNAFCRPAPPDFTEHQRQVFCVFSGTGVDNLRRYFNTRAEFAEFNGVRNQGRRRSAMTHGAGGLTLPTNELDGYDEADGGDDDEMGDGSEIALDPAPQQDNSMIPPPPPHHPGALYPHTHAGTNHATSQLPFQPVVIGNSNSPTTSGVANGFVPAPVNQQQPPNNSSLEQVLASQDPASTAGATLFGHQGAPLFTSEASLHQQEPPDDGQEHHPDGS